jgi:hypothetical protein
MVLAETVPNNTGNDKIKARIHLVISTSPYEFIPSLMMATFEAQKKQNPAEAGL